MATLKFDLEAGLFMRGSVRRWLRGTARANNLELKMDEEWGLLDSHFWIVMSGSDEGVIRAHKQVRAWVEQHNDSV
jgi:hypothetical protein